MENIHKIFIIIVFLYNIHKIMYFIFYIILYMQKIVILIFLVIKKLRLKIHLMGRIWLPKIGNNVKSYI